MTRRRMTDQEVSRLPLAEARAELMGEIMREGRQKWDPKDAAPTRPGRGGSSNWLPAAGVAAAVAVLAGAVLVLPTLGKGDDGGTRADLAAPATVGPDVLGITPAAPGGGEWIVLPVEGWEVTYTGEWGDEKEIQYESGEMELAIHLRPADQYQEYLDDRMDIGEPTPATLLGGEAQTWSYSQDDHTAIAAVSEGFTPEVRGSFMDKETYLTLVEQLIWVDQANFEAAMPEEFVTDAERETVIAEMLADVPVPEGFEASSEQSDRYALGAEVTGAVACHWLRQYADLYGSGDEGPKQEAVDALGTSRDWAILQEMDEQGDWPETIWEYADQIARGERPENVNAALGCSELG